MKRTPRTDRRHSKSDATTRISSGQITYVSAGTAAHPMNHPLLNNVVTTSARSAFAVELPQQIGQEMGRGGSGTVFQALNTSTGDFVAVKRVALHDIDNDSLAAIKVID